jgi:hypothetical protein
MTEQHRAKPEVWAAVERWSKNDMDSCNCTLELRDRVEALEAAAKPVESNDPVELDSSLVVRVADAIYRNGTGDGFREEARAAILAVVEALEAALRPTVKPDLTVPSSSLMEEVVDAITDASAAYGTADEPARAAILATANWLDQQELHDAAKRLRQEVG